MGLKDLFAKWSKGSDDAAIARAESGNTEDFEGQKADIRVNESYAGGEAAEVARDDLDDV